MIIHETDVLTYKSQVTPNVDNIAAVRNMTDNTVTLTNFMSGNYDLFYISNSPTPYTTVFLPKSSTLINNITNSIVPNPSSVSIVSATFSQPVDVNGDFVYTEQTDVLPLVLPYFSVNTLNFPVTYSNLNVLSGNTDATGIFTKFIKPGTLSVVFSVNSENITLTYDAGTTAYFNINTAVQPNMLRKITFSSISIGPSVNSVYLTPISQNESGYTFGNTVIIPVNNFDSTNRYFLKIMGVPSGVINIGDNVSQIIDVTDESFDRTKVQSFDGVNNDFVYIQDSETLENLGEYTTLTLGKRNKYYPLQIETIRLTTQTVNTYVNTIVTLPYCTTAESAEGVLHLLTIYITIDFSDEYPVEPVVPENASYSYQAANIVSQGGGNFQITPRLDANFLSSYTDYFVFRSLGDAYSAVGNGYIDSSINGLPNAVNIQGWFSKNINSYKFLKFTISGSRSPFYVIPFSVRINSERGVAYRFISMASTVITMNYSDPNSAYIQPYIYPALVYYPMYATISMQVATKIQPNFTPPTGYSIANGYYTVFLNGSDMGKLTNANGAYTGTVYGLTDSTIYNSLELQWTYTSNGLPDLPFSPKFITDPFLTDVGLIIPNSNFVTFATPILREDMHITCNSTFDFTRTTVNFGTIAPVRVSSGSARVQGRFGLVLDDGQEVDFDIWTGNTNLLIRNLRQNYTYSRLFLRYYPFLENTNVPLKYRSAGSLPCPIPNVTFNTPIADSFSARVRQSVDNTMTLTVTVDTLLLMQNVGFSQPTPMTNFTYSQFGLLFTVGELPVGVAAPSVRTTNQTITQASFITNELIPAGYTLVKFTNITTGTGIPDPIVFKITNLQRDVTYKSFNVSLTLLTDYTQNSNQTYLSPFAIPARIPIEYIPNPTVYSFQSTGILTNFDYAVNTGYTGTTGAVDISYPSLYGATLNVVGLTGSTIYGQANTPPGATGYPIPGLPISINRNILPSTTYSGLKITYEYPGGTAIIAQIPAFSTSEQTLNDEVFRFTNISVIPDIYNSALTITDFDYNKYSFDNSLPISWGGSLVVKDTIDGIVYGTLSLSRTDSYPKTLSILLNEQLLRPRTIYSNLYISYVYENNVGSSILTVPSFITPATMTLSGFSIYPLANQIVIDIPSASLLGNTPFSTSKNDVLFKLIPSGTSGATGTFQQQVAYAGSKYRGIVSCNSNINYNINISYQYDDVNFTPPSVIKTVSTLGNKINVGVVNYGITGTGVTGSNTITIGEVRYVGKDTNLSGGNLIITDLDTLATVYTIPTDSVFTPIVLTGLFTSNIYRFGVAYQSPASIELGIFNATENFILPDFVPSYGLGSPVKITNFTVSQDKVFVSIIDIFINGLRFNGAQGLQVISNINGITAIMDSAITVTNGCANFTFSPSILRPYSAGDFSLRFIVNGVSLGSIIPLPGFDFQFSCDVTDILYEELPSPGYYGTITNIKYAGKPAFNTRIGVFNPSNAGITGSSYYDTGVLADQNFAISSAPLLSQRDFQSYLTTLTPAASTFIGILQSSPNFKITNQDVQTLSQLRIGNAVTNLTYSLLQLAHEYSSLYPTIAVKISKPEFYAAVASMQIPGFTSGRILSNVGSYGIPYSDDYTLGLQDIVDFVYYYFFEHFTNTSVRLKIITRQDAPPLDTDGLQTVTGSTISPMRIRYKYPRGTLTSTAYSSNSVEIPFPAILYDTTRNNGVTGTNGTIHDIDAIAVIRENIAYGMIRTWNENDVYDGTDTQDRESLVAKHTYSRWVFGSNSTVNYPAGQTGFQSELQIKQANPQLYYTNRVGLTGYTLVTNSTSNRVFSFIGVKLGLQYAASALVSNSTSEGKRYLYKNKTLGRLNSVSLNSSLYTLRFQFGVVTVVGTELFTDITNFPYILLFKGNFPHLKFDTAIPISLANVDTTSPQFIIGTDTPFSTITGYQNEWLAPYRFIRDFDCSPEFNALGSVESPVFTTPGTTGLSDNINISYTYGITGPTYEINIGNSAYQTLYNEWVDFDVTGGATMRLFFTPRDAFPRSPALLTLADSAFSYTNGEIDLPDSAFGSTGPFYTNLLFNDLNSALAVQNQCVYTVSGKNSIPITTPQKFYKLYVVPYNFSSSTNVYSNLYTFANFVYTLRNSEITSANKILGSASASNIYYSTCTVSLRDLDLIDDKLDPPLSGQIPSIASQNDLLYITDQSGNLLQTTAMSNFSFGSGTTDSFLLTGLTENTVYTGIRIYYKFASSQTQEIYNYLTIPTFQTPPAFTLDAGFNLCITKAIINIASIQYSGRALSSTYPVSSNNNILSVWIFSSTDSTVSTEYTNILVDSNFRTPKIAVVKTLIQGKSYDKIGFRYSVLDERRNTDTVTIYADFPPVSPNLILTQDNFSIVGSWVSDPNLTYNVQFYSNLGGTTGPFGPLLTDVSPPVYTSSPLDDGTLFFAEITPISFGFQGNDSVSNTIRYEIPLIRPIVVLEMGDSTATVNWEEFNGLTYTALLTATNSQTDLNRTYISWSDTNTYYVGDIVSYVGVNYICVLYNSVGAYPGGGYINGEAGFTRYWKVHSYNESFTNATTGLTNSLPLIDGFYYKAFVTPSNLFASGVSGSSNFVQYSIPVTQPLNAAIAVDTLGYFASVTWDRDPRQTYTVNVYQIANNGSSSLFQTINDAVTPSISYSVLVDGQGYYATVTTTNASGTSLTSTTNTILYSVPLIAPDPTITIEEYRLRAEWTPASQLFYSVDFMESPNGTDNWTFFDVFSDIRSSPVYTTKQLNDNKYYKVVVTPNNIGGAGYSVETQVVYFSSANQTTSIVLSQGYLDLIGTWHPLNGVTYSLQFYESTDGSLGSAFGSAISVGPLDTFVTSYTFLTPDPYDGKYYTAKITPTSGTLGTSNTIRYTQLIVQPSPILRFSDSLGTSPGNTTDRGTTGSFPLFLTLTWVAEPQIRYLVQFFESQTGVTGANDNVLFQSFGSTGVTGTTVSPITSTIPCNDGRYYRAVITPANSTSVGLPSDTGFINRFLSPLVAPTNFNMTTTNGVLSVYWDMFPGLAYDIEIWQTSLANPNPTGLTGGTFFNAVPPIVVNATLVENNVYYAFVIPKNSVVSGTRYSSIGDLFALTSGFTSITYTLQPVPTLTQSSTNLRVRFSPGRSNPTDPTQFSENYNINVYKNATNSITGGTLAFNSPYNDPLKVINRNYGSYNLTGQTTTRPFSRYSSFTFTTNFTPSQCAFATNSYALVYTGTNSMFGIITSFEGNTLNFFSLTSSGTDPVTTVLFTLQNQSQNTVIVQPSALTTLTISQFIPTISMTNYNNFTAVPIMDITNTTYPYPLYSGFVGSIIQITIDGTIDNVNLYLNRPFIMNSTILNSRSFVPGSTYNAASANYFTGGRNLTISAIVILTEFSSGVASFLVQSATISQPQIISSNNDLIYAERFFINSSNINLLNNGSYYYAQLDDGFGNTSSSQSALRFLGPLTTPTSIVCSIQSGIPSVTWTSPVRGSEYKVEFYGQSSPISGGYAGTLVQTTLNVSPFDVSTYDVSTYNVVCNGPLTNGHYVYAVITPMNSSEYGTPVSSIQNVQFTYTQVVSISQVSGQVSVSWNASPSFQYSVQLYSNGSNSISGGNLVGSPVTNASSPTNFSSLASNLYYYAVVEYSNSIITASTTSTSAVYYNIVPSPSLVVNSSNVSLSWTSINGVSYSTQFYSNATNSNTGGTSFGSAISNNSGNVSSSGSLVPGNYYYAIITYSVADYSNTVTSSAVFSTVPAPSPSLVVNLPNLSLSWTPVSGVSYSTQFYSNATNSNTGGTEFGSAISNNSGSVLKSGATVDTYYYTIITYTAVNFTNTVTSSAVLFNVPAPSPSLVVNLPNLSLSWTPVSGVSYSTQFYSNATNSNTGGTSFGSAISNNSGNVTASGATVGTYYYGVITYSIPNYLNAITSSSVLFTVPEPSPTIGLTISNLSLSWTPVSGVSYSTQFYSNATNSNTGGTSFGSAISNNSGSVLSSESGVEGTYYYAIITYSAVNYSNTVTTSAILRILLPEEPSLIFTRSSDSFLRLRWTPQSGVSYSSQLYRNFTSNSNTGGTPFMSPISDNTGDLFISASKSFYNDLWYYVIMTYSTSNFSSTVKTIAIL